MRSHALQTPSQSRSGSAHCEVIFFSYCAVCACWLTNALKCMASACIFEIHTQESRSERALRSHVLESGFLGRSRSKTFFHISKAWFETALRSQGAKIRLSNQERGRMTLWNVFRNAILAHVNTAIIIHQDLWTILHVWKSASRSHPKNVPTSLLRMTFH